MIIFSGLKMLAAQAGLFQHTARPKKEDKCGHYFEWFVIHVGEQIAMQETEDNSQIIIHLLVYCTD